MGKIIPRTYTRDDEEAAQEINGIHYGRMVWYVAGISALSTTTKGSAFQVAILGNSFICMDGKDSRSNKSEAGTI